MQRIDEFVGIAQLLVLCVLSLGDFKQIQNVMSLRNDMVYGLNPSDRTDEVSTDLVSQCR
ncbi:hypothetical protein BDA96_07G173000 [Sorghum bicolor]|uniref:Uncharacterized protein n=3 Tax=Sorghum bicolor TaxID=4558 RepID=A0A921QLV0_SORBI|nr:hypothetical protein BDA96_07G173000 [Sorghum bicolor]KXG25345.1 hypothetical protein SORBI_3007G161300 [Sorghum bicolor]